MQRLSKVKSLNQLDFRMLERINLFFRLDALHTDMNADRLGKFRHHFHEGGGKFILPDVNDKTAVIKRTGIVPENLTLEVTEGLAINDMSRMKKILSEIRALGVRVALDDFGTGNRRAEARHFCRIF